MRRSALAAIAGAVTIAGIVLGPAATPTWAGDRIDRAAAGLRTDPLYLAPGADRLVPREQADRISSRLRRATTPIFIAVLPVAATRETGRDPGRLPAELYLANGQRTGTYAVLAGPNFRAGSTELGTIADEIAQDAQAASGGNRADTILRFIEEVELKLWKPALPAATATTANRDRSSGFPYAWLFGVLAVVLVGLAGWARAKTAKAEQEELDLSGDLVAADLRAIAEQVEHAKANLGGPQQDAEVRANYARALAGLAEAKQKVADIDRRADVADLARTLDESRYALACALARTQGQPLPIRPPCVFDPLHPAPASERRWAPDGAEPRLVPVCPADADRLLAGTPPVARTVTDVDVTVPYWAAGTSCRAWAQGWYGTGCDSEQLYALFAGTPLGAALDDPSEPTEQSPLDGWTEPEPSEPAERSEPAEPAERTEPNVPPAGTTPPPAQRSTGVSR
jgi:hypothetical protein